MPAEPIVSMVVPSFNQARYLGECLESLACYPHEICEILVMDGGSNDGSVEVIRRYERRLAYWQSRADGGQAAALQAGFRRARGRIFGWLNSDDRLVEDALTTVIAHFDLRPDTPWAYGDHRFIDSDGRRLATRHVAGMDYRELYWGGRYLPQEAVFFRRGIYFEAGEIAPDAALTMDFDLWLRLARLARPGKIPATLGEFRRHPGQKTGDITAYHAAAHLTRTAHPPPPPPSPLRRLSWTIKHATYRYGRTAVEHGPAAAAVEVARSCGLTRRPATDLPPDRSAAVAARDQGPDGGAQEP
jgi:hypothetical protein